MYLKTSLKGNYSKTKTGTPLSRIYVFPEQQESWLTSWLPSVTMTRLAVELVAILEASDLIVGSFAGGS